MKMSTRSIFSFIAPFFYLATALAAGRPDIDLAGKWAFELDPDDRGVKEAWHGHRLKRSINLPGSVQEQGYGNDISVDTKWTANIADRTWYVSPKYEKYRRPGKVKVPFWLQPEKEYVGPAWYQREIEIPPAWSGKRVVLILERCHWETTVWLDDEKIGVTNSLSTRNTFVLFSKAEPGRHRLTLRVDNRLKINVGANAHSVSDHTQSNWNGVTGRIELVATDPVWIDDVQVYPDVEKKGARVRIRIGNFTGERGKGRVTLAARGFNSAEPHEVAARSKDFNYGKKGAEVEVYYPLGEGVRLWDEFDPALYRLVVKLAAGPGSTGPQDRREVVFAMREFATQETQFTINGRRTFLRGTLESAIFPLTGYPPMDVESWKRVIRVCKSHGLNHIRFHSWCPPKAAFVAADELGFYLQVECASWTTVGDGKPVDKWVYEEGDRILREYGNHPSFVMLTYGNEPGGKKQARYLGDLVNYWKKKDPRHLYTSAAGWPMIEENQFHSTYAPRVQQWGAGLKSRINAKAPETRTDYADDVRKSGIPLVSHEIGQWCVYPNFAEIKKYTGVLKPRNFEIFRDTLGENHMGDQARDFFMASGRLQVLCYKEDIESALRTRGFGGFQLLDLHDFPGQGTALVGVLDPFWDSKDYVTPAQFRRFCASTVPLARMSKRTWTQDETFMADVEVAHFGPHPLKNVTVAWSIVGEDEGKAASGEFPPRDIPVGNGIKIGKVSVDLAGFTAARKYRLVVGLDGTPFENDWGIWVFPDRIETAVPEGILLTRELGDEAVARLKAGGKVLIVLDASAVKTKVQIGFSSIFWNTSWTRNQPPHTLGILCDPAHPVFETFPTEYHSDWQWWELVHSSAAMILDGMPAKLKAMVQPIDTWFENRRLGLLFEARIGDGKLMVCSMDLVSDLETRPVARQMRHSLLEYMRGADFDPSIKIELDRITALMKRPPFYKSVKVDSWARGYEAKKALDDDGDTLWHTKWTPPVPPFPHHLTIELADRTRVKGISYLPRQDMSAGRIAKYEIHVSDDSEDWGAPVASGAWPNERKRQKVLFKKPVRGRYVRLTGLSEVDGNRYASVAEFNIIKANAKD